MSSLGLDDQHEDIRSSVRDTCKQFPESYWRELDKQQEYPTAFVEALTKAGWLAALIPEEYEGAGLGITEASIILEEIDRSGGLSAACHAQMYTMGAILRHGSDEQKRRWLPPVARGELRLQSFGVTEPTAGSETTRIQTKAVRKGDKYIVNGHKVFISRFGHSDVMLLLARTTPYEELKDKTKGLSMFLVDIREAKGAIQSRKLDLMLNHDSYELFIEDLEVPAENMIGEEGTGFRNIIDGWNAERILIAAEAIGKGRWCTDKASKYSAERIVFGRPIGSNQGVQFPIVQAYIDIEAADLMRFRAAALFDAGRPCGAEANMAKYLASEASWKAANACMDTFGGYGFAAEYDVERVFRETRLLKTAPISNNLVLTFVGQRVLGMPRTY